MSQVIELERELCRDGVSLQEGPKLGSVSGCHKTFSLCGVSHSPATPKHFNHSVIYIKNNVMKG